MRRFRHRVFLATATLLLAGLAVAPAGATTSPDGVPQFGNVFLIIGENTSLSQISANNAPYEIKQLQPNAAWFTDYFASSHYSTSNYVAMTSGQYIACEQEDVKPIDCHQDVPNLFNDLDGVGAGWKVWNESMPMNQDYPGGCYLLNAGSDKTGNAYRPKHNPAEYYVGVVGSYSFYTDGALPSAECRDNDVSTGTTAPNNMDAFHQALSDRTVPAFNYVVPNMCEDGHDNCKPTGNPITQFDDFLAREVPIITTAYPDALVMVTYDEGQGGGANNGSKFGGGNVLFAMMGPQVVPGTYGDLLNHYSLLRMLEDGYRTGQYPANSATAMPFPATVWAP
jgi:phosphatidylinositol-3-phosphatase